MADTDWAEPEYVRSALGIGQNDDVGEELGRAITVASDLLDNEFGAMVVREVTANLSGAGNGRVTVPRPVGSITSITENGTLLTASDYRIDDNGYGGIIRLVDGEPSVWSAQSGWNVVVVYQRGRFADTASVAEEVKHALIVQMRHMWRSESYGAGAVDDYDVAFSLAPMAGLAPGLEGERKLNTTNGEWVHVPGFLAHYGRKLPPMRL